MESKVIIDNCKACTESYSCPYYSMISIRDMERCQDAQLMYEYEREVRAVLESDQPGWMSKYNMPVTVKSPGISRKLFLFIIILFVLTISVCATLWFIPTLLGLLVALAVSLVLNKHVNKKWL